MNAWTRWHHLYRRINPTPLANHDMTEFLREMLEANDKDATKAVAELEVIFKTEGRALPGEEESNNAARHE